MSRNSAQNVQGERTGSLQLAKGIGWPMDVPWALDIYNKTGVLYCGLSCSSASINALAHPQLPTAWCPTLLQHCLTAVSYSLFCGFPFSFLPNLKASATAPQSPSLGRLSWWGRQDITLDTASPSLSLSEPLTLSSRAHTRIISKMGLASKSRPFREDEVGDVTVAGQMRPAQVAKRGGV